MIINEEIKILINHRNKKIYERFNPIVGEILTIKTSDLPKGSRQKIKFKCDLCSVVCQTSYYSFNKTIESKTSETKYQGLSLCKSCCQLKSKKTMLDKYGETSYTKTKEYKDNLKIKFGVNNISQLQYVKNRKKEKSLERYGVDCVLKSTLIREKIKQTNLSKYGVDNPTKNRDIFEKAQASAYKKCKYQNTDIIYQGSYELDFINYCNENSIEIEKGPSIPYIMSDKHRIYHSDFYIKKYNLICEIKSTYTYNQDIIENLLKKDAALFSGFNFLFIIDKNYIELIKIIKENEKQEN